jgi:preprotein translocase subunit SecA
MAGRGTDILLGGNPEFLARADMENDWIRGIGKEMVASNPAFYNSYVLAGDYLYKHKEYKKALQQYNQALTKVIATKKEEDHIKARIKKINKKLAP